MSDIIVTNVTQNKHWECDSVTWEGVTDWLIDVKMACGLLGSRALIKLKWSVFCDRV